MTEVRELEDYPGYGTSSDGRLFCRLRFGGNQFTKHLSKFTDTWRQLKPSKNVGGYIRGNVRDNDGNVLNRPVHRLVWFAWGDRPLESNEVVRHKNGDKHDNRIENLQPGSQSDNVKDWHDLKKSAQGKKKMKREKITDTTMTHLWEVEFSYCYTCEEENDCVVDCRYFYIEESNKLPDAKMVQDSLDLHTGEGAYGFNKSPSELDVILSAVSVFNEDRVLGKYAYAA